MRGSHNHKPGPWLVANLVGIESSRTKHNDDKGATAAHQQITNEEINNDDKRATAAQKQITNEEINNPPTKPQKIKNVPGAYPDPKHTLNPKP